MLEAYQLHVVDDDFYAHRQAYLNFMVQATRKSGRNGRKPVYRRFVDFYDYEAELKRARKKDQKEKGRFKGIGKFLRKGGV